MKKEKVTFIFFFLSFFFLSLSSLTGLTAANRLLAKSTQICKHRVEVWVNSRDPIYNDGGKKDDCNMKRKKIPKNLCEMSKYLTFIPLLKEMYFSAIPGWWRKKKNNCGKRTFLRLYLMSKWAHVIWSWTNRLLDLLFYSISQTGFVFVSKIYSGRCFYTYPALLVSFLSWWLKRRWPTISLGQRQHVPLLPDLSFFSLFPF